MKHKIFFILLFLSTFLLSDNVNFKYITYTKRTNNSSNSNNLSNQWPNQFKDKLINSGQGSIHYSYLKNKYVGLYFSAHWCGPCRQFTPKLAQFHYENSRNFAVVFISLDRSKDDQLKYMREYGMPWAAVEWHGSLSQYFKKTFNIRGIPTLIVLDPTGNVVTKNGRGDITQYGNGALNKWMGKKPNKQLTLNKRKNQFQLQNKNGNIQIKRVSKTYTGSYMFNKIKNWIWSAVKIVSIVCGSAIVIIILTDFVKNKK